MFFFRPVACKIVVLNLLFIFLLPVVATAGISSDYSSAWNGFKALVKNEKQGKYRANWKKLENKFVSVYKRSPSGSYAPKALYYAARVNEELGKRSYVAADYRAAQDYYQRAAAKFPKHSWADDCLYRSAEIGYHNLHEYNSARRDLNTILRNYTTGDMYPKAVVLHRKVLAAIEKTADTNKKSVQSRSQQVKKTATVSKSSGAAVTLRDVRFQSSNDYTRVVLDLSGEAKYSYQILSADPQRGLPFRLYVDLENTSPADNIKSEFSIADGILRRVRTGTPGGGTSRVVLDFQSVQKSHVFSLDNPYRVVIDVTAPKDSDGVKAPVRVSKPSTSKKIITYKAPPGSKDQVGDLIEQLGLTVKTIMIDAGHGGKDPGAMANGIKEKDHVLKVAQMVGRKLKALGYTVLYTRTNNVFVPLEERTAMANVRKADMFISFHVNANRNSRINGVETYYLNLARSKSAVRIAARENAVSEKRISDLQFILTDLMLNSKMQESKDLATMIQKSILKTVKKHKYATKDNGVRSAPFYVLMGAKMPSVLVELGYCTNSKEARRLKSDKYLSRLADGIVNGVQAYKQQINRFASM